MILRNPQDVPAEPQSQCPVAHGILPEILRGGSGEENVATLTSITPHIHNCPQCQQVIDEFSRIYDIPENDPANQPAAHSGIFNFVKYAAIGTAAQLGCRFFWGLIRDQVKKEMKGK